MKKFDYKKVMVALMTLIMVFALVGCGNKGGGGGGETPGGGGTTPPVSTSITADTYFTGLWNSFKTLGKTAIADGSNWKAEFGFAINGTATKLDKTVINVKNHLDIAVVYDRNNGQDTAVKLALSDISGSTPVNVLTTYYFLNDPTKIYFDYYGQKIIFPFVADSQLNGNANSTFYVALNSFLTKKMEKGPFAGKSFDDVLNETLVKKMGTDSFGIDGIVGGLVQTTGFDLVGLLNKVAGILNMPTVSSPELLPFLKQLGGAVLTEINAKPNNKVADGLTYSANLNSFIVGILNSFVGGFLQNSTVSLSFDTDKNLSFIDNFAINIEKENLNSHNIKLNMVVDKFAITEATESDKTLAIGDKTQFSADAGIELNTEISLAQGLLKFNIAESTKTKFQAVASAFIDANFAKLGIDTDGKTIESVPELYDMPSSLEGKLRIEANGKIDLLKTDSKTKAFINIYYTPIAGTEVKVGEASFVMNEQVIGTENWQKHQTGTLKIWFNVDGFAKNVGLTNEENIAKIARDYIMAQIIMKQATNTIKFDANGVVVDGAGNYVPVEVRNDLYKSNIAIIRNLMNGIATDANTFIVEGLEIQTYIWDILNVPDQTFIVGVDDASEKVFTANSSWDTTDENGYVFEKIASSQFQAKVDLMQTVATILRAVTFNGDLTVGSSTLSVKDLFYNNGSTAFGIFSKKLGNFLGNVPIETFTDINDYYAWLFMGNQEVVNKMTDGGVIGAIKVVDYLETHPKANKFYVNKKGILTRSNGKETIADSKYLINVTVNGMELKQVRYYALEKSTSVQTIEANCNSISSLGVPTGKWFYQNSSTISKSEMQKMWQIANYEVGDKADTVETEILKADELTKLKISDIKALQTGLMPLYMKEITAGSGLFENVALKDYFTTCLDLRAKLTIKKHDDSTINMYLSIYNNKSEEIAKIDMLNGKNGIKIVTNYSSLAKLEQTHLDFTNANANVAIDNSAYGESIRKDFYFYEVLHYKYDSVTDTYTVTNDALNDDATKGAIVKKGEDMEKFMAKGWASSKIAVEAGITLLYQPQTKA